MKTNFLRKIKSKFLIESQALEQKWYRALELVFCITHDFVPDGDETCQTVNINSEKWHLGKQISKSIFGITIFSNNLISTKFSIKKSSTRRMRICI